MGLICLLYTEECVLRGCDAGHFLLAVARNIIMLDYSCSESAQMCN